MEIGCFENSFRWRDISLPRQVEIKVQLSFSLVGCCQGRMGGGRRSQFCTEMARPSVDETDNYISAGAL